MPALDAERQERAQKFNSTVGSNIDTLRAKHDVSMAWLADQADVSISQLSRVVKGQRELSFRQGILIARALGVSPMQLTSSPVSNRRKVRIKK
jgi:transcriptional regulator with XRE-family HTH domain